MYIHINIFPLFTERNIENKQKATKSISMLRTLARMKSSEYMFSHNLKWNHINVSKNKIIKRHIAYKVNIFIYTLANIKIVRNNFFVKKILMQVISTQSKEETENPSNVTLSLEIALWLFFPLKICTGIFYLKSIAYFQIYTLPTFLLF